MADGGKHEKEITIELKRPELVALIAFLVFVLALELVTTMKSPIIFGDEGFHTRLAQMMAQQKDYFAFLPFEKTALMQSGYDRPPLWGLLEAGFMLILGFSETLVKFLTPLIAVLTGLAVFLLSRRLFDEKVAFIAAVLTVAIPSFVTYSVLFYTDILLTFYTALAVLLFVVALKEESRKYLVLSAVFASLAFLTKAPGVAAVLFLGLAFLYEMFTEKRSLHLVRKYGLVFMVVLAVVSGYLIRNLALYGTPYCYNAPLIKIFNDRGCSIDNYNSTQSFSAVNAGGNTDQSVWSMGLANYLDFALGNVWFIVLGAVAGFALLVYRKDRHANIMLLYLAFFMLLFPMVTARAEDAARYTLNWVFLFAVLAASFFAEIHGVVAKYNKYMALTVFAVVLLMAYANIPPKLNTMATIKQFTPDFFQACDWVNANLPENTSPYTVWANRAIYSCQRNAVSTSQLPDIALGGNVSDIVKAAARNGVDYIFVQKFSIDPQNRGLAENYNLNFVDTLASNNRTFTKVYENGPDVQQCMQQNGCDGNIIYRINASAM